MKALQSLSQKLTEALRAMELPSLEFGMPRLVETAVQESEEIFQGYAKAKPRQEDAYAAARNFLQGRSLDAWQRDLVASAIAVPVVEQAGTMVIGTQRFADLLAQYEEEANSGNLWRLTWHGLLYSYFHFDPTSVQDAAAQSGWNALRSFLERTWPLIDEQAGKSLVPDWVTVLRKEPEVLSTQPADKYAQAYLEGNTERIDQLANHLGIPPSSWFWHALVLSAVKRAAAKNDVQFRNLVPRLIDLVHGKPGFRDEALEIILTRYCECKPAPLNERLRDYVCQANVWKNPKLHMAGIATAWSRVSEKVWKMVLGWVNEGNLRDFFAILASRNKADEGRLEFWSRYLDQISNSWTRLVFSADTMALKRTNAGVRDLIAREEGAYAELTGKRDVDAFMMQLGSYVVIEFSKKPNACYVYKADELPFEPYAEDYTGGREDLAAGFREARAARIVHTPGWEERAEAELAQLGIQPDPPKSRAITRQGRNQTGRSSNGSTSGTPDMTFLRDLIQRFPGAVIDDKRTTSGGRLWVKDARLRKGLDSALNDLGFKWADSRQAWYFPEN